MLERFSLPLLLLTSGVFVIGIHDYAYRRVAVDGDYVFFGLLSHAGADMAILTVTMLVSSAVWLTKGFRE